MNLNPEELYSPKKAAEYLHCHLASVYRYIQKGKLVPVKISDQEFLRKEDLDAFQKGGEKSKN
ncbi:MAG: helix-turn-helix domain-containing protein [Methylobacter sp.]|jgi:excisionase family DNA binding protein|nr:helix-turn-helix domain-containing protein [Methylobacter sp.]